MIVTSLCRRWQAISDSQAVLEIVSMNTVVLESGTVTCIIEMKNGIQSRKKGGGGDV